MKQALQRSAIILVILALSVAFGFAWQKISDSIDRKNYPRQYEDVVTKYSVEYGVPEYVIYAVIRTESNFDSGAKSAAGALGLMQIMPDTFDWMLSRTHDGYETGMLYDPDTNVKYGTYLLSYLFLRYNDWDAVYAAYNAGYGRVDSWLSDPSYSKDGKLTKIPLDETRAYVKKVASSAEKYKELYYD
jgi:soluble lytic murein transglycosylase